MAKKILMLVMITWLVGCRQENPVAPVEDIQRYFPLALGNTWVYNSKFTGQDTTRTDIVRLVGSYNNQGLHWYSTGGVCLGSDFAGPIPLNCASYARDNNKVLAKIVAAFVTPGGEAIMDFPLFVGKQWTIASRDTTYLIRTGDTVHYVYSSQRFVRSQNTLTVAAGTFSNCFYIEDSTYYLYQEKHRDGTLYTSSSRITSNEWFTRNVGLIKQAIALTYNDSVPVTIVRELRSYNVRLSD